MIIIQIQEESFIRVIYHGERREPRLRNERHFLHSVIFFLYSSHDMRRREHEPAIERGQHERQTAYMPSEFYTGERERGHAESPETTLSSSLLYRQSIRGRKCRQLLSFSHFLLIGRYRQEMLLPSSLFPPIACLRDELQETWCLQHLWHVYIYYISLLSLEAASLESSFLHAAERELPSRLLQQEHIFQRRRYSPLPCFLMRLLDGTGSLRMGFSSAMRTCLSQQHFFPQPLLSLSHWKTLYDICFRHGYIVHTATPSMSSLPERASQRYLG